MDVGTVYQFHGLVPPSFWEINRFCLPFAICIKHIKDLFHKNWVGFKAFFLIKIRIHKFFLHLGTILFVIVLNVGFVILIELLAVCL